MRFLKSKVFLALLVTALVAGGGLFVVQAMSDDNPKERPTNSVDYGGPTDEEAAAGDKQKEANRQREEADANTEKPNEAEIIVVDAGQYEGNVEIRGYIANLYEDGGSCTATFTRNGQTITKTTTAFKDARVTQCRSISVPRAEFPEAGEWQYSLYYSSSSADGKSETKNVVVRDELRAQ